MNNNLFKEYTIDYVEIYAPMAKIFAYWHTEALGFTATAVADSPGVSSIMLTSNDIRLVLTSSYPMANSRVNSELNNFISNNYCGVKRFALRVDSVKDAFEKSIANGAFPLKFPTVAEDEFGSVEEAAIRLYDFNEIVFINRDDYSGIFKPGYKMLTPGESRTESPLLAIDHIASEVRINESGFWTKYLTNTIGTHLEQSIQTSEENKTGMILNVNQSPDRRLTLVIAEPEAWKNQSKVQKNIDAFGPGIHHLAFSTNDLEATARKFIKRKVDFVKFPPAYYDLLRQNNDFKDIDVDSLEANGIIIDKEGDTYLLQKFITPVSDRPFFLYEIIQRVNGYSGFALKNINILKKAEEMEIMKSL
jgi:4-hydroxyphenylpyruvate dioxygenase